MKLPVLFAGLSLLAATGLAAQSVVGRDETSYQITERISPGRWVRIATPNGTVRIVESRGSQVEIRATKDVRRGSIEDVGFIVRRGSGDVTVCAVYDDGDECDEDGDYRGRNRSSRWWREHQIKIDFTVSVPASARVKAGSGNGDVMISGVGAEVSATSGNGQVIVEGAEGPVEASSGNGEIRVSTTAGPVNASSGNGDIEVSIERLDGSPDMDFSTGNGRIVLTVPEGFGAELQSSTGNGRVDVDFPLQTRGRINHSRIRGTIGGGGGRLVMSSGNGDLEVRRRTSR